MKVNLSIGAIAEILNKSKALFMVLLRSTMIMVRLKQESLQVGQE